TRDASNLDRLYEVLQSGQGFPSAARALAEAWGRPVLLQDPSLDIRAVGLPSTGSRGEPQWDALLKDRLSGRMIWQLRPHLIDAVARWLQVGCAAQRLAVRLHDWAAAPAPHQRGGG